MEEIIDILKNMASTGQPPQEGCSKLGVGYDSEFAKLKKEYIEDQFQKGKSTEKFVVGPYGAGKTHFLRQFIEVSKVCGCATAEIQLSKAIDITKQLTVYKEVVNCLKVPGQNKFGMEELLRCCIDEVNRKSPDPNSGSFFIDTWIAGLAASDLAEPRYKRVLILTIKAFVDSHNELSDAGIRWLEGDVSNRHICKILNGESPIPSVEQNLFGQKALFCLCQFIRYSGFKGTIVAYDQADEAVDVGKKKKDQILSMLRTESDARRQLTNNNASAFFMYAFTPPIIQDMNHYPALLSRIQEPDPRHNFFDGNVYSPIIDLQQPYQQKDTSLIFLQKIGERLVYLFYKTYGKKIEKSREDLLRECYGWADEIDAKDQSIQKRRDMVKLTCSRLIQLYETSEGTPQSYPNVIMSSMEDEV